VDALQAFARAELIAGTNVGCLCVSTHTFAVTADKTLVEGPPSLMSPSVTVGAPAAATVCPEVGRFADHDVHGDVHVGERGGDQDQSAKAGRLTAGGVSGRQTSTRTVNASTGAGPDRIRTHPPLSRPNRSSKAVI